MACIVRCNVRRARIAATSSDDARGRGSRRSHRSHLQHAHGELHATQTLPATPRPHRRARRRGLFGRTGARRRHHQGRHPALAVGNDGHQRNGAEGRRADDDRRHQQEGRRAGQAARARRRRPGVELAAVRREGPPAADAGQGRRRVRLLDVGVAQVGAAGVRGTQRRAVLPGPVRGRGAVEERVLHGRGAEPAGDPRGRVPDEQGRRRRQALGAARHRLRLPAHDQQDPARVPEVEGRRRQGHRREVHAVRPQRLPDHRRRHQEVLGRRQDGRRLDDQRRLERAVLQGTGQPGPQGDRRAGRGVLGRRRGAARRRHQAAGRPPRGVELLHVAQESGQRRVQEAVGRLRQGEEAARRRQAADQRPDGSHVHRHPHVEAGGREGEVDRIRTR